MYNNCRFNCGAKVPNWEGNICGNCRKDKARKVATVTLTKVREMQRSSESAAEYYAIRVEPGTYPVELRITGKGEQYLAAVFTGKVITAGYGNKPYTDLLGTDGEVVYQPYRFQLVSGQTYSGGVVEVTDAEALAAARGFVTC